MLRLISVVTARYNWRNDELSIGQRDMARLWAVNERTVKREMKRLTEANILWGLGQGSIPFGKGQSQCLYRLVF